MSRYEDRFALMVRAHGLPEPVRQHRFATELGREFRLDFAWPDRRLALEVDGGRFVGKGGYGRRLADPTKQPVPYHQTDQDYRKRNLLQLLGWTVLAYPPEMIASGEAINELALALELAPPAPWLQSPAWEQRLAQHVDAGSQRDRQARVKVAEKKRRRMRRDRFLKELAEQQARWRRPDSGGSRTAPASRTPPSTAPQAAASAAARPPGPAGSPRRPPRE